MSNYCVLYLKNDIVMHDLLDSLNTCVNNRMDLGAALLTIE